jgi:hypothetical protein
VALALIVLLSGIGGATAVHAETLSAPTLTGPSDAATVTTNPEFTWTSVPLAVRYRVQISTSNVFSTTAYSDDVYGTTATPLADLPTGPLFWHVASIDSTGTVGPYSATGTLTKAQATPPTLVAPANGAVLNYPGDRPILSWQPVAGMKQYRVQIDDDPSFGSPTTNITASTSYALPVALPSSAVRFWRVQGISTTSGVTSAWSSDVDLRSFSVVWDSSAVPSLLEPASSISTDVDDMRFRWSPVPGASSYELQLATNVGFTIGVTSVVTHATQYRPLNTLIQDQYYWRVRALQNGEPADWSSISSLKREWLDEGGLQARPALLLPDSNPGTPGIQAQLENDKVTLRWTPIRRAAYYQIQISTDSSFSTNTSCNTPHTTWTPYLSGNYTETAGFAACSWSGSPATTYYVRVRAVDTSPNAATITSLWSNFARPGEGTPPAPVSFVLVSSTSIPTSAGTPAQILSSPDSSDTPLLTWRPVSGTEAYLVWMAKDSGFTNPVLSPAATTQTELMLNEVLLDNTVGEPYHWFVLPCSNYVSPGNAANVCVGPEQAINIPGQFATFDKQGDAVDTIAGPAVQTDTVAISWTDQLLTSPVGGATKFYEYEVRNTANVVVDTGKTDATGYTPVGKTYQEGTYTWRVRAIDGANIALAWSVTRTFDKKSSAPTPLVTSSTVRLPVLRWTPTSFASSYEIEIYRGSDPVFPLANKVGATLSSDYPVATPTVALPAGDYTWRVRQLDAMDRPGGWSTEILPFTVATAVPAASTPGNGSAAGLPSLVFRWAAVDGAVRYRLQSSLTAGFAALTENVVTVSTAFAPTSAYSGGTQYFWRVAALNGADDTMATSSPFSFTALTTPSAPAASATATGTAFTVSWNQPATGGAPITGYVVRYRAAGAGWTELFRGADVRSVTLTGLATSTKYEAQVTAINDIGTGPFSGIVSATTATVPGVPGSLKVTPKVGSLLVAWSAPANGGSPITGYIVRYAPSAGGSSNQVVVAGTSTTLLGLANLTSYNVDVAATNAVGTGPFATSVQGVTLAAVVAPAPTSVGTELTISGGRRIVFGGTAALSGALKTSGGVALAGKTVTIQSRVAGGTTTWAKVTTVTTGTTGTYTATVKPTVNREYRTVFAGTSSNQASTSSTAKVLVRPKITRHLSANNIGVGRRVVFSGSVAPAHRGKTIYLQRMKDGKWISLKSAQTSATSTYSIALTTRSHRDFAFRIMLPAHADHAAGYSPKVKLIVR